jgi:hypothetical protein
MLRGLKTMSSTLSGLIRFFAVLLLSVSALAQGVRYQGAQTVNSQGLPIQVTVRVCTEPASGIPCTPLATVYSDKAESNVLGNPFNSDVNGNWYFYATPLNCLTSGYHAQITGNGIAEFDIPDICLVNPFQPTACPPGDVVQGYAADGTPTCVAQASANPGLPLSTLQFNNNGSFGGTIFNYSESGGATNMTGIDTNGVIFTVGNSPSGNPSQAMAASFVTAILAPPYNSFSALEFSSSGVLSCDITVTNNVPHIMQVGFTYGENNGCGLAITATDVSTLPNASIPGTLAYVLNGASSTDCTAGFGSFQVFCVATGSGWVAVGGFSGTITAPNIPYASAANTFSNTGFAYYPGTTCPDGTGSTVCMQAVHTGEGTVTIGTDAISIKNTVDDNVVTSINDNGIFIAFVSDSINRALLISTGLSLNSDASDQVTLSSASGGFVSGGNFKSPSYSTATNCANGSSPATCGSAASGAVAVPTGATPTLVVDTSAVTANSRITLTIDESLTISGVTCNTTLANLVQPVVTARTASTSFTMQINATVSTHPVCVSYLIVN